MSVKLAGQTLSAGVADALQFILNKNDSAFVGCQPTIKFIRIIDLLRVGPICIKINAYKGSLRWKGKHVIDEIMIQYAYPRLDINVSKGLNHLLKSPFCIHPKTGKVCCPFKPRSASKFDPTAVPTISELIEELSLYDEKQSENKTEDDISKRVKGYKKTSLNSSVHIFEEVLRKLEATWKGKRIEISDQKMEF